jgi:hypothetical protein
MDRACSMCGRNEKYVQNFDWKKTLGRPRRKWTYNIKIDCREIGGGWEFGLDSSGSA